MSSKKQDIFNQILLYEEYIDNINYILLALKDGDERKKVLLQERDLLLSEWDRLGKLLPKVNRLIMPSFLLKGLKE